ncbi:aspartate kinase [Capnocytophaga sp. ARDL2]|uniref:aspartate kinase n=1 Tax=Capnocytophaga sp. ARDL2 TaxID=3238809 RepID=UPI003558BC73
MKIYKFGGASIKDADAIRNVANVLKQTNFTKGVIVASAMGKTTNALEEVVAAIFHNKNTLNEKIDFVEKYHLEIVNQLFENKNHRVFEKISMLFSQLKLFLDNNKSPLYNFVYDQIVSMGEVLSTTILSEYLNEIQFNNQWLDARNLIKTDNTYREAIVDWKLTEENIQQIKGNDIYVTQGFIGSDANCFSVTLGREGSDYSAAIFAYCLDAKSLTIWKDVPGVLNADPRYFEDYIQLQQISYTEAIELSFYGASVIHPKTLQPLQKKEIPLYVKSFIQPEKAGTAVSRGLDLVPYTPCFIVKKNQLLISFSSKDFSFILENQVSEIFKLFAKYRIKVQVIQNSAISFSVCVEDKFENFDILYAELKNQFAITYNKNVNLYTVRHFTSESIDKICKNKEILLQQINRNTIQIISK